MARTLLVAFILISGLAAPTAAADTESPFDQYFTGESLRLDLSHSVTHETDHFTLDRIHVQGDWAGPRRLAPAVSRLGAYRLEMSDAATGERLFIRNWDSIAAEYRATAEARKPIARTFQETLLVPAPRKPVTITIRRLESETDPVLLERAVDPTALTIGRSSPPRDVTVIEHRVAGPVASNLDVVFVGEGYAVDDSDQFARDLAHFADLLLGHEPFASLADHISVRGVVRPSTDSGCDEPTRGLWVDTAVGASFNALGSPRYLLTEREWTLRDIASAAPYDALIVMVNHERYGGGGLFNTWCTFTTRSGWSDYLLLHEFGHSFAGLADEYYTSSVAYEDLLPPGVEPAAPNVTALLDPATLKWRHLMDDATPLPTPWPKAEYDRRDLAYQEERRRLDAAVGAATRLGSIEEAARVSEELETLTTEHVAAMKAFLAQAEFADTVGAFEGGGYATTGLYRPAQDCLMFSRGVQPWCPVCRAAVENTVRGFLE
jgi:hypothetical protein